MLLPSFTTGYRRFIVSVVVRATPHDKYGCFNGGSSLPGSANERVRTPGASFSPTASHGSSSRKLGDVWVKFGCPRGTRNIWKTTRSAPNMAPKVYPEHPESCQDRPKSGKEHPKSGQSVTQDCPEDIQDDASTTQDTPRLPQRGSKRAEGSPVTVLHRPKSAEEHSKTAPRLTRVWPRPS